VPHRDPRLSPGQALNVGGMDPRRHQMPGGVGNDVAFAAFDLLTGIVSARTAAFRRLGGLAVDHPSRWTGLGPGPLARLLQQQEINPLPQSRSLPGVKVALHRRAIWKIARQQAPRRGAADRAAPQQRHAAARSAAFPDVWPAANAARSTPIPRRSCHLHSANLLADTADEWFQSTCCLPLAFSHTAGTTTN